MVNITKNDDVFLRASKLEIIQIFGIVAMHLCAIFLSLSFIVNFMLKPSWILGSIAIIFVSSTILTSAMWLVLRWVWGHLIVNDVQYQFVGKIYPLFGMFLAIVTMLILVEATLGVIVVALINLQYIQWKLIIVIVALVLLILGLIYTARYLKKWVNRNVKPKESVK